VPGTAAASSPFELVCLDHGRPLREIDAASSELGCDRGCRVPVVGGIPRFVPDSGYASSFGLQWNRYRRTQLDSHTGTTISRDRLSRCLGGSLEIVAGARVLEAGCGAGRFTEILLGAGAKVLACDLSEAVEANRENCGGFPDYAACQADILRLPVRPGSFELVLCLGVIQHTPDPERTIAELCGFLEPGGLLVIDHYSRDYPLSPIRRRLRRFMLRRSPAAAMRLCRLLVTLLWPLHRLSHRLSRLRGGGRLRRRLLESSPVVDYQDSYPELDPALHRGWALLDTHDTLTDAYKHLRSPEEIAAALEECGMVEIEAVAGGNGVEARARRPVEQ
jgi:SAM-dependent methyltransferase